MTTSQTDHTGSFHVEHVYSIPLDKCPVCGSGEWQPHLFPQDNITSSEHFTLTLCKACGFCATNPRPSPQNMGRFYESPDYISHTNTRVGVQDKIYHWVRRRAIRSKHRLIAQHKASGKVLDLGCGTGDFLGYLKKQGYLTTGVEPNFSAREQTIAKHAVEAVPDLDQVPALEQFQVITLWHVLEHVHDVRDTLKKLHARLATRGLLVLAVPDRESWDAKHYGAAWAAYDVPRHLSHFRRQDLRKLIKEHGFRLIETRGMWFDAPYVSMLSEKHKGTGPVAALLKGTFIGMVSNVVAAITHRPTSSSLYLAEKV